MAWLAFAAFAVSSLLVAFAMMAGVPDPSGKVALIYRPGTTQTETFRRAVSAGARPIRWGRVGWIIVVAPEPGDAGFAARAHAAGVLAIVNPLVAGGCSTEPIASLTQRRL